MAESSSGVMRGCADAPALTPANRACSVLREQALQLAYLQPAHLLTATNQDAVAVDQIGHVVRGASRGVGTAFTIEGCLLFFGSF
jgi:hypothetical protein